MEEEEASVVVPDPSSREAHLVDSDPDGRRKHAVKTARVLGVVGVAREGRIVHVYRLSL